MIQAMKAGHWQSVRGRELSSMTVGVLGAGSIGKRVIELLHGFGSRILTHDLQADSEFAQHWKCEYVSLETLMRESNIVTIHCSLNDTTRGLIGLRELNWMKADAYLVNTARPHIVDYAALLGKLQRREIAGAAIDVHDPAPCSPDDILVSLDNVLPTSWSAYNTSEAIADMSRRATEDLVAVLQNRAPRNPVNDVSRHSKLVSSART
jgi:phosphoglycerate dehydrogenase-like enzyme